MVKTISAPVDCHPPNFNDDEASKESMLKQLVSLHAEGEDPVRMVVPCSKGTSTIWKCTAKNSNPSTLDDFVFEMVGL